MTNSFPGAATLGRSGAQANGVEFERRRVAGDCLEGTDAALIGPVIGMNDGVAASRELATQLCLERVSGKVVDKDAHVSATLEEPLSCRRELALVGRRREREVGRLGFQVRPAFDRAVANLPDCPDEQLRSGALCLAQRVNPRFRRSRSGSFPARGWRRRRAWRPDRGR